jgi:hypothetical protein
MLNINNPGNIRNSSTKYIGELTPSKHKSFKTFENIFWGYRAMFKILNTYISSYHLNTIDKMINRYAPPIENDTEAYIKFVCDKSPLRWKLKKLYIKKPYWIKFNYMPCMQAYVYLVFL